VRVSSVPVAEGERIVLRLLHRESTRYTLNELGMSPAMLELFRGILREPHGIVLVTGPTGSGKTTTLYAALRELDTAHLNVLTIEDPIEYQLPNIGQMQVHPKIGLTFARGLRHILRQDPDVVLVGETRDLETAEIVVRASLTGHLVFTTLHTNDAVGAVTRMVDMGIPPYLLASAARAVLAQRLVRRLCPRNAGAKPRYRRRTPSRWGRPAWPGARCGRPRRRAARIAWVATRAARGSTSCWRCRRRFQKPSARRCRRRNCSGWPSRRDSATCWTTASTRFWRG
jgi:type II secretory ATPase GspE/PulE/Tfp pilus assembly ATPase PilB-like protein